MERKTDRARKDRDRLADGGREKEGVKREMQHRRWRAMHVKIKLR